MFGGRYVLAATVVCAVLYAAPSRVRPDAGLSFRQESGVETRLLLAAGADWDAIERVTFSGGFAVGAIENPGVAHYGVGAAVRALDFAKLGIRAQVNHDEWSGWEAGENRMAGMVAAGPLDGLEVALGMAWRAPLYAPAKAYRSPFEWSSEAPEWNWVYRLDWTFLDFDRYQAAVWCANIDRLTIHNPQQFPAGLRASYVASPRWRLTAQLGTDIKGLSALLFAFTELDLRVGVASEL